METKVAKVAKVLDGFAVRARLVRFAEVREKGHRIKAAHGSALTTRKASRRRTPANSAPSASRTSHP